MAVMLSACMIFSGLTTTIKAEVSPNIKTNIIQNKDDTYTLENYAKSLDEVNEIKLYNLLTNKVGNYKITVDADADWIEDVIYTSCRDNLDGGLGRFYYKGTVSSGWNNVEELTDKDGKNTWYSQCIMWIMILLQNREKNYLK